MKTKKNRIRKSTKYSIIVFSIVLLIFSLNSLKSGLKGTATSTKTKEVYNYTNKFNYDYKINLIKNKYMTNKDMEDKTLAYVTDLIDNIDLNLNYNYSGSEKSALSYTYSITGRMQVVYTRDGEKQKIIDKEEILLKEKTKETLDKNIDINEKLLLDLKDKNELLKEFKEQIGMTIDAKYMLALKIKVTTNVEGNSVENEFIPVINIDLSEKTTTITGDNDIEKTERVSGEYTVQKQKSDAIVFLDIVIIIVAIILLRYALRAKTMNKVRNEYKYELNKILKLCKDKIVEVYTRPNDEDQDIILVKDFGEIMKVSEELFKPILYYNVKEDEEAWFYVTSEKANYRYILKK